ncbi:MAG: hypothetical protein SF029_20500 [bacterium]|nr:hypothetical protein [bacterium]
MSNEVAYVIDTNVWILADGSGNKGEGKRVGELSEVELECIQNCLNWLIEFSQSGYKLAVDLNYLILGEYDNTFGKGGLAEAILNQFRGQAGSIIYVNIKYYEEGGHKIAIVSEDLQIIDKSDRKFVAVALEVTPRPSIINASDTDWEKSKEVLFKNNIRVEELCPNYIAKKFRRNSG